MDLHWGEEEEKPERMVTLTEEQQRRCVVRLERCKNCGHHQWCTKHDESKYERYESSLVQGVEAEWPLVTVRTNRGPGPGFKLRRSSSAMLQGHSDFKSYVNVRDNSVLRYPRLGAFEVTVNREVVFSKLKSGRFPNVDAVVASISKQLRLWRDDRYGAVDSGPEEEEEDNKGVESDGSGEDDDRKGYDSDDAAAAPQSEEEEEVVQPRPPPARPPPPAAPASRRPTTAPPARRSPARDPAPPPEPEPEPEPVEAKADSGDDEGYGDEEFDSNPASPVRQPQPTAEAKEEPTEAAVPPPPSSPQLLDDDEGYPEFAVGKLVQVQQASADAEPMVARVVEADPSNPLNIRVDYGELSGLAPAWVDATDDSRVWPYEVPDCEPGWSLQYLNQFGQLKPATVVALRVEELAVEVSVQGVLGSSNKTVGWNAVEWESLSPPEDDDGEGAGEAAAAPAPAPAAPQAPPPVITAPAPSGLREEGERVEGRYRGGSKWFKGRVTVVHDNGTVDVMYDDGDIETGMAPELVRSTVRTPAASSSNVSSGGLRQGDRVQAQYQGTWYKGRVSGVNDDGTVNVTYDDGTKQANVTEEFVKSAGRTLVISSGGLQEGDRVQAKYRGGAKWFSGRVSRVNDDGTVNVTYDDGDQEANMPVDAVRGAARSPAGSIASTVPPAPREAVDGGDIEEGARVVACYRGKKWYPGTVLAVHGDDCFDVRYDDGDSETRKPRELVKLLREKGAAGADAPEVLAEGALVEALFRGKKWFTGVVTRVHEDGRYDVRYDDGDSENRVKPEYVRSR